MQEVCGAAARRPASCNTLFGYFILFYVLYVLRVFYPFVSVYERNLKLSYCVDVTEMLSLVVQLALSQKQLKAANEQISDLKERLMTIRESHDDIKEDFDKVSKEVKRRRCPRYGHPRD